MAAAVPSLPAFPTRQQFAECFPAVVISKQDAYYDATRDACAEFSIDTAPRVASFLAQVGHETAGLVFLEELGGVSHFLRYEGRHDLGNRTPGDGVRYHGRGLFPLVGKTNYAKAGALLGLPLVEQPELAAQMPAAARIGALHWQIRGLNEFADMDSEDGFRRLTQRLTGGLLGYPARHARWKAIRKIMEA